jgi:hypothetical protein
MNQAWIVTRDSESDSPELFLTEEAARQNACLGVATTHIYPCVWGVSTGTLVGVGKRVARRSINLCPCHGHLCDHCAEAKELLNDLGANDERHFHKAHYEAGKLTDECDQCGRDLRNPIHITIQEDIDDFERRRKLRGSDPTRTCCEYCGTPTIDNCLKCGAPQCCPKCCQEGEWPVKDGCCPKCGAPRDKNGAPSCHCAGWDNTPVPAATSCCGHDSDCAVHNAPALPVGPCDCKVVL